MLDPLTALGVAASVVQFVDFSVSLISKARKIRQSVDGSVEELANLQRMVAELKDLKTRLLASLTSIQSPGSFRAPTSAGLQNGDVALRLGSDCAGLADRLILLSKDLEPQGGSRWLGSIKLAHKLERRKPELEGLEKELRSIRSRVQTELLNAFKNGQSGLGECLSRIEQRQIKESDARTELTAKLQNLHDLVLASLKTEQTGDLAPSLSAYIEEANVVAANKKLLASLRFQSMRQREAAIYNNHDKTFEWIFESPDWTLQNKGVRIHFLDWLRTSNGIFWISGKAGSGKSTLMKFLSGNQATYDALRQWAGTRKLVVASHFFWSTGDSLQNSQLGLLRTLCHEILQACPDLISVILEETWPALDYASDVWTLQDLSKMVDIIQTSLLTSGRAPKAFCFFVDGLDEYQGDHVDIIRLLQRLTASTYVKICASSRPWNVFENAFGAEDDRKILLQNLTQGDIAQFVNDQLTENKEFIGLSLKTNEIAEIVNEIQTTAKGVFLWVFLVVRELLKSVTNGDSFEDLLRRLRSLPSDLEGFFQHIFDTLDPFYRQQTARAFLICLESIEILPVLSYCLVDPGDPFALHIRSGTRLPTNEELLEQEAILAKRINARVRDLLEVQGPGKSFRMVNFLHRTVRDYLYTQDMTIWLREAAGDDFELELIICWAHWIAICIFDQFQDSFLGDGIFRIHDLIHHASEFERIAGLPLVPILDWLWMGAYEIGITTLDALANRNGIESGLATYKGPDSRSSRFWAFVFAFGLTLYIQHCLEREPSLRIVLNNHFSWAVLGYSPETVSLLLKHDLDPNLEQKEFGKSTWSLWLENGLYSISMESEDGRKRVTQITEVFLQHRAIVTQKNRKSMVEIFGESETQRLVTMATAFDHAFERPSFLKRWLGRFSSRPG